MLAKNALKPMILLSLLTAGICIYFWTTSRYPDLSVKAVLGGNSPLASLGFSPIIEIDSTFTFWQKVFADTLNWMHTNKKGMTFSFFAGACFLSLIPLLKRKSFKRGFSNSVFGLAIGAPLGVCVNCAAPIARSLHAAGTSLQTSLSALIASPTLNIVVTVMAFSMFPFYLVAIKLTLTLVFILMIIPIACHYLFPEETAKQNQADRCEIETAIDQSLSEAQTTWLGAFWWLIKTYVKNFLFLLKVALPFMILAGFLGSLCTTLIDWSAIQNINNNLSTGVMIATMVGLSVFGALLPSPMSFDVILSSVLLQAGVPIQYVAVFLFTLGSFSIYAFLIIWRSVSLRVASFLYLTTAALGLFAGFLTIHFEDASVSNTYNTLSVAPSEVSKSQIEANEENYYDPIKPRIDKALSYAELKPILDQYRIDYSPVQDVESYDLPADISLQSIAFQPQKIQNTNTPFTYKNGEDIGILQPYEVSYTSGLSDFVAGNTMSVAAADVHNDGWPDILLMGDHEIRPNLILYANINGEKFIRQDIPWPKDVENEAINVALIDLDGDQWKDIVFSTYEGKNYVIYNEEGAFLPQNLQTLSNHGGTTVSMSFGDIDNDSDLDIFIGNWSVGPLYINAQKSKNYVLKQDDKRVFSSENMPGLNGETLSSLFHDFNDDGYLDLYIGNDFLRDDYSDLILLNNKNGTFSFDNDLAKQLVGGQTTMSVDIGDIDNDLNPDIYIGQIAYTGQFMRSMSKIADRQIPYDSYCTASQRAENENCESEMRLKQSISKGTHYISDACDTIKNDSDKAKCVRHVMAYKYFCDTRNMFSNSKNYVDKTSPRYQNFCNSMGAAKENIPENYDFSGHIRIANSSLHNVLLRKSTEAGRPHYTNEANERGVGYGAWTWNARFADLDNDGWQDLYVANGYSMPMTLSTNIFYRNIGNGHFEDATKEFGFENYTPTSAYSLIDIDQDGDLDVINNANDAPVYAYINNNTDGHSISFELLDFKTSNLSALNATVSIHYTDGASESTLQQQRIIKGSGGYRSYNEPAAHFGLGKATEISEVHVKWPDGTTSILKGEFLAGHKYQIIRNSQ